MKQKFLTLLGFCCLLSAGCTDEGTGEDGIRSGDGATGRSLELTLEVPGSVQVTTRATGEDENELKTVDVLWFTVSADTGEELFAGRRAAVLLGTAGMSGRTVQVYLPENLEGEVRPVVLANLRGELAQAAGGTPGSNLLPGFENRTKAEVMAEIAYAVDGSWPQAPWRPIPMWGESPKIFTVTSTLTANDVGTISLIRATARVDVYCDYSADAGTSQGLDNFKLETVTVYNMPDAGRAVPDAAHYDATGGAGGKGIVTAPTVPETTGTVNAAGNTYAAADNALTGQIYTPETSVTYIDNGGDIVPKADEDVCCLVVGGYYNGSGVLSYYRVDFNLTGADGTAKRIDLLRNHRYRVNITAVRGDGLPSADEAFADAGAGNMIAWEIEARDESSLDNVVFDGRYHLTVSQTALQFYRNGPVRMLNVFTDHPDGWEINTDEMPEWLQFEDGSGNVLPDLPAGKGGETTSVWINVTGAPTHAREGNIQITAGSLRQNIMARQQTDEYLDLEITPSKLCFSKKASNAQSFTITLPESVPEGTTISYNFVPGTMAAADMLSIPDITGAGTYQIQPRPYNATDNSARESFISVTMTHGNTIVQKLLTVIQRAYDGLAQVIARQFYATEGSKGSADAPDAAFSVDVFSENDWSIGLNKTYYEKNPAAVPDWLTIYKPEVQPPTGEGSIPFHFGMTPNYTYADRVAMLASYDERTDISDAERREPFQFSLTQKGEPLKLDILSPAPLPPSVVPSIDFGGALVPEPKTIRLGANSRWMWKVNDAFGNVVKSYTAPVEPTTDDAAPNAGGNGNPWTYVTDEIVLTPFSYAGEDDLPLAADLNGEMILRSVLDEKSIEAGVQPIELTIPVKRSLGSVFSVAITLDGQRQTANTTVYQYPHLHPDEFPKEQEVVIHVTTNKECQYHAPDGTVETLKPGAYVRRQTVAAGEVYKIAKYNFKVVCGSRTVTYSLNKLGYQLTDVSFEDSRHHNGYTNAFEKDVVVVVKGVFENMPISLGPTTTFISNTDKNKVVKVPFIVQNTDMYNVRQLPLVTEFLGESKQWSNLVQLPEPHIDNNGFYYYTYLRVLYDMGYDDEGLPEKDCPTRGSKEEEWGMPDSKWFFFSGRPGKEMERQMLFQASRAITLNLTRWTNRILCGGRREAYWALYTIDRPQPIERFKGVFGDFSPRPARVVGYMCLRQMTLKY